MPIFVKVGELKNHLSAYLKKVRGGAVITISDRETPIGKIVPYSASIQEENFDIVKPSKGYNGLASLSFSTAPLPLSVVDYLLEERKKR